MARGKMNSDALKGESKSKVVVNQTTKPKDTTIKYRSDFGSWDEYNKYKGKKG